MSTDTDAYRDIEQERHEQALEQQGHSANLMADELQRHKAELIDQLMESELDNGTIKVLDNYVSRDFVLGNMQKADFTQFKWQLEIAILQVFAMHPPQEGVGGKARAYYYDDPNDALVPLKPQDRAIIREFKDGIIQRVGRSLRGFQQDKIGETTSRVETINRQEDEEGSGRIRGLLGR